MSSMAWDSWMGSLEDAARAVVFAAAVHPYMEARCASSRIVGFLGYASRFVEFPVVTFSGKRKVGSHFFSGNASSWRRADFG